MAGEATLTPVSAALRPHFTWLEKPALRRLIAALEAAQPGSARFVGGCVRDSLLGEAPKDYDLATLLPPEATLAALRAAGIEAVPTGIDHGTVTAVIDHQGFEVTSLRADVETDGRRAVVAFTEDWAEDGARRDFTINAIYLTPDGLLFDPVGGLDDIAPRRVRFIGDPVTRIREDALRILRFFRFSARFSEELDENGLAACVQEKHLLGILSAERIGAEVTGLLALPRAAAAVAVMAEQGVLAEVWDAPPRLNEFGRLKEITPQADAALGLAVLYGAESDDLGDRLRLSNVEKGKLSEIVAVTGKLTPTMNAQALHALIYTHGARSLCDALTASAAHGAIDRADFARLTAQTQNWPIPTMPIAGRDLIAAGVPAGPRVSQLLQAIEAQWIDEDFPAPSRVAEIMAQALRENA